MHIYISVQAYIDEGAALAFKQSEMEKTVRKARAALRSVQEERDNLAKEKSALEARVSGLVGRLKAKDDEKAEHTQSMVAMGAISQASSHKLTQVEKELEKVREESANRKAALDKSWMEIKDMKRVVMELRADNEALAKRVDATAKMEEEAESSRRGWEQQKSILLSTQAQLEDALARAREEADQREDLARAEQADLRKRWKDAVARVETMQAEAYENTAPLLQQARKKMRKKKNK
ncbi:unnamed protein product [Discosporangium mesarthrocarpum]